MSSQKRSSTAEPPVLKPRYRNGCLCVAFRAITKHLFGIFFTVGLFLSLLLFAPFVVIVRFVQFIWPKRRRVSAYRHCDPWWPFYDGYARMVLAVQSNLELEFFTSQINNVLGMKEESRKCSCFVDVDSQRIEGIAQVECWDQRKARLKVTKDFMVLLNDANSLLNNIHSPSFSVMVPDFTVSDESRVSLLIIAHNMNYFPYCLPRLLSLYTESRLVFDLEPKMGESFSPSRYNTNPASLICNGIAQIIRFLCIGPLTMVMLTLRKPGSVWNEIAVDLCPSSSSRSREPAISVDDADLMRKLSDVSNGLSTNRRLYRWLRIPQMDLLSRAERLLRAATIELLLAFVAGTLRRHFRLQGIMYPADIAAAVPISYREYIPVEARKSCEMALFPIQIPCGVEGIIPRVWAVQRRLAGVIDGVLPTVFRISELICDQAFTTQTTRSLFTRLYTDVCIVISLFRASGEVELDARRIQSILIYPSVPASVKVAFTFVHCGPDIMLSLSVNERYFPDPDQLLLCFKTEVLCLLDQLSMRLLTISQTSFFPSRIPVICETTVEEHDDLIEMQPSEDSRPVTYNAQAKRNSEDICFDRGEIFIRSIQKQLDDLRLSWESGEIEKEEYVDRLTDLEREMKVFHNSMTRRFGSPTTANLATLKVDAELASCAVAELLAPYRAESGGPSRRFSREFLRTDVIRRDFE